MPLGPGVRYRVSTKGGKKVRLALRGDTVIEAKNMETGALHTKDEFKEDRAEKKPRRKMIHRAAMMARAREQRREKKKGRG